MLCPHRVRVKKQQLEPHMEQQTGSKLGKKYVKTVYCHSTYLTYMQSTSCEMLGWKAQAGIKIAGRNINNLRYADDTIFMTESKEELKNLLMKVKGESGNTGLKQHSKNKDLGRQSHHFMANTWGNNGNSDRLYILWLQNHCRW